MQSLVRWSPLSEMMATNRIFDRVFDRIFEDMAVLPAFNRVQSSFPLAVDVIEREDGYEVTAQLPGFSPEQVEVTLDDGVLRIRAEHKQESETKEGSYLRRELVSGSFYREIPLPGKLEQDQVKASFADGVLTINVAKAPTPQPVKIEVKPAAKQIASKN